MHFWVSFWNLNDFQLPHFEAKYEVERIKGKIPSVFCGSPNTSSLYAVFNLRLMYRWETRFEFPTKNYFNIKSIYFIDFWFWLYVPAMSIQTYLDTILFLLVTFVFNSLEHLLSFLCIMEQSLETDGFLVYGKYSHGKKDTPPKT